jgi:16S rRNA processing protein RimM
VQPPARPVWLGRIGGAYGVRGWVRLRSDTDPPEQIAAYSPWWLSRDGQWRRVEVQALRRQGAGLVAQLQGCTDRDQAAGLTGSEIAVERDLLPKPGEDEFYWADLIGLEVRTEQGGTLGRVEELLATGANDVLVVRGERERLIPFLRGQVVREVDLDAGRIVVDWDPEF